MHLKSRTAEEAVDKKHPPEKRSYRDIPELLPLCSWDTRWEVRSTKALEWVRSQLKGAIVNEPAVTSATARE